MAEYVARQPIKGSWWGHPASHQIFAAINDVLASPDIVATRLIRGKLTLIHRRLWPAVVRVADRYPLAGVASVHQAHATTGEHRTTAIPFPKWVSEDDLTIEPRWTNSHRACADVCPRSASTPMASAAAATFPSVRVVVDDRLDGAST